MTFGQVLWRLVKFYNVQSSLLMRKNRINRDSSQKFEKIAICRGKHKISQFRTTVTKICPYYDLRGRGVLESHVLEPLSD